MPYITQKQRKQLVTDPARNSGELNYLLCKAATKYAKSHPKLCYNTLQQIVHTFDEVYEMTRHKEFGYSTFHLNLLEEDMVSIIRAYYKKWPLVSRHDIKQGQGALRCAQLEFYRKVVAPYEDLKCETNGEVFV